MSGHSKWSTIKHKKAAQDKKRGTAFTKLAKAIVIAVREGGSGDIESNFSLRLAVDRAKAANMPKDNVSRAIQRGLGKSVTGAELRETTYEVFGPHQVGMMVETLTDNTNRTVSEVKKIIEKAGGTMASPGSVGYMFEKKGRLTVVPKGDPEEMMLTLIDLGAEDVDEDGDRVQAITSPDTLSGLKDKVVGAGFEVEAMELALLPKAPVSLEDERALERVSNLIEALDEHDDVSKVWPNLA